jgi:hypothetical protein
MLNPGRQVALGPDCHKVLSSYHRLGGEYHQLECVLCAVQNRTATLHKSLNVIPYQRPCPLFMFDEDFEVFVRAFNAHRLPATTHAREAVTHSIYSFCGVCGRDKGNVSIFHHHDEQCPGLGDEDERYWYYRLIYMAFRKGIARASFARSIDPNVDVQALERDPVQNWAKWAATVYCENMCRASMFTALYLHSLE